MKKNTLLLALLATAPAMGQQVIMKDMPEYFDELNVIPSQFTINNVPILHIEQGGDYEYDEEEYSIALYNDDIEKIAEVKPANHTFDYTLTYHTQTREVKDVTKEEVYREYYRELGEWYTFDDFIRDENYYGNLEVRVENGDTIVFQNDSKEIVTRGMYDYQFFGFDYFGTKYPFAYCLCKDNIIYRVRAQYYATYTDWSPATERKENESCKLGVSSIYYQNFDTQAESNRFTLSQTLFNNDEKFEYIIPKMVLTDISNYATALPSLSTSLVLSKTELVSDYAYPTVKGLQVVSSDGTILHDLDFTNGFYMEYEEYDAYEGLDIYGITIGGKDYLIVQGYMESQDDDEEDEECALFYRINRQTSSLQEVKSLPVKMRVKQQESTINVQLSDTTEPSEIIMTNEAGATIAKKYVPAGEAMATFKTSIPKGVYNITRLQNGKGIENGKIVMK